MKFFVLNYQKFLLNSFYLNRFCCNKDQQGRLAEIKMIM